MSDLKTRLIQTAKSEGFAAARVTAPDAVPHVAKRLRDFLEAGYHGQMGWLAERAHWRGDPGVLWPEARSILMLADLYTPDVDPLVTLEDPEVATISVYARNRDYHDIVKKRLKRIARWLQGEAGDRKSVV